MSVIVGKIRVYRNDDDECPENMRYAATLFLQKDGNLSTFHFGATKVQAYAKLDTWWQKHKAKYEERYDSRKTTSPMGKLSKALLMLEKIVDSLEITSDPLDT